MRRVTRAEREYNALANASGQTKYRAKRIFSFSKSFKTVQRAILAIQRDQADRRLAQREIEQARA